MSKVESPPGERKWKTVDSILESAVSDYNEENPLHGELDFHHLGETVSGDSSTYEFSREGSESYLVTVSPQLEDYEEDRLVPDLRNEFNMPEPLFREIVFYTCAAIQEHYR